MRRGGRLLILLGIMLGMLSAFGVFVILSQQQSQPAPIQTRSIVIALQPILARTEIPLAALGKADYPENVIPVGAFERTDEVSGKLAIENIYQGQIILPPMIIDKTKVKDARSNASFLIPDGKVAIEFPVSPLSGVGGALQPGDYVDLLLTLSPNALQTTTGRTTGPTTGTEGQPVTQLMLQDVLILQVGLWGPVSSGSQQNVQASFITFVLAPQDALALKSAREQGTIELALRRAGDHKQITTEPVSVEYLNRRFNFKLTPSR